MINIDSKSSRPIYEQIMNEIKEDILKGILKAGDRLPSVREMASSIPANPNTVSRAYMELEREKVIETVRGKGTFISSGYKPKIEEDKIDKLKDDIKKIIIDSYYLGIKKDQIIRIMDEFYRDLRLKERGDKY